MKRNQNLWLFVAWGGVAIYLALFFTTRLPSIEGVIGGVFRRVHFCLFFLSNPEIFLDGWLGESFEPSILDRLPVLAAAVVILGYAASLGWWLMALSGAERKLTRAEVCFFSTAVGLNVVSTYVLLVGLVGLLGNILVFAVPAAMTLAAAGRLHWHRKSMAITPGTGDTSPDANRVGQGTKQGASARNVPSKRKKSKSRRSKSRTGKKAGKRTDKKSGTKNDKNHETPARPDTEWLHPGWLWLAAPAAIAILLGSMLPPIDFDVREYHLQVPKEFYQAGRIDFLPHNVYGNMAMGTEMLSLLGMIVAHDWWLGALAGKTVIGAFAPLTALGLWAAGRRFFSPAVGVVAAILYLATPWIVLVSTSGLVEGASACYLLAAVYAVLLCRASPTWPRLALAGYLAGSAVSTKYPAALFVFLPLAVWIVLASRSSGWRPTVKCLAMFVLAGTVGCGLWFGKNWVLAGNPTYPLLDEVFASPHWSAEKNAQWNRAHRPHDFSLGAMGRDTQRVLWKSEWLGPLLVPLAVLGLAGAWGRRQSAREQNGGNSRNSGDSENSDTSRDPWRWRLPMFLAGYILYVVAAWWFLTHRIDRFWIPVLPLAALLAGEGACWSDRRAWRWSVVGLLVLGVGFGFLVSTSGPGGYNRYFVALEELRVTPTRVNQWHVYLNDQARGGRVLLVGDAQPFDIEVPVTYNTVFDDLVFEQLVANRSAETIRREFAERGITHVFVHWGEIARYRSPGNYGFSDFVQPEVFDQLVVQNLLHPPVRVQDNPGVVYEVTHAPPR